jgi:hypothetical protein
MPAKVVDFAVHGPFDVPIDRGARTVNEEEVRGLFWDERRDLADAKGCYVFAIRTGRGVKPLYVGRTTRANFRLECFTPKNQLDLNKAMREGRGTLLLYLVKYEKSGRGADNRSAIEALETQLIGVAAKRNPGILNTHGARPKSLPRIQGVLNSTRGRPTKPADDFKKMMAL